MSTLKEVYAAKKEFINDDAVLSVEKLEGGYNLNLWHNQDKFDFVFTVQNRKEVFKMIIELFNCFDFSYYLGGDIQDLSIFLTGKYDKIKG